MSDSPASIAVPVTRFAPSPSGHLHVGGARTALLCWAFARGRGGKFLLRIEDTDQKRSSDAASVGFLKDLDWLGIDWNEGPEWTRPDGRTVGGGPNGPYFQSERVATYDHHLGRLLDSGAAYYAFDTADELDAKRKAATARGEAFRYRIEGPAIPRAEAERRIAAGESAVIRFRTPVAPITIVDEILGEATLPAGEVDDFVIRKADGFPTYHFAVVVDDELMGVTHVLRAQEHFNNTAKHIVLQDALGFRRPTYGHLPLIFNPDGSKMSKRDKDKTLRKAVEDRKLSGPPAGTVDEATFAAWRKDKNTQLEFAAAERLAAALDVALPEINVDDFRRSGYLPEVLCNFLALNGWSPGGDREKFDNEFLARTFDLKRVVKTPAKFDRVKLLAFNCDAITGMPRDEFVRRSRLHGEACHAEFLERLTAEQFRLLAEASHERSKTLDDLYRGNRWLVTADDAVEFADAKPARKAMLEGTPSGLELLRGVRGTLGGLAAWTRESLETAVTAFAAERCEGNLGRIAQPLRVGVTGATVSPPIFDTLAILGKDATLRRIDRCLAAWEARAGAKAG
jgi:glutamyl-tRNA synthetase